MCTAATSQTIELYQCAASRADQDYDVLDNVIAVVINDSCGSLKGSICTVRTFYNELQHLSTAKVGFFPVV